MSYLRAIHKENNTLQKSPSMTVEDALEIIRLSLGNVSLNDLQETIFRQSWEQKTYPEIAVTFGYDADYIKLTGFQLWHCLSDALGEKVTKSNFRSVLGRYAKQNLSEKFLPIQNQIDWGDAIDVSVFYGRDRELITLKKWMVEENCRLIAVLGIGGTGKTALAVKIAEQIQESFEYVIWRSLQNAPSLNELINHLIQFLATSQQFDLSLNIFDKITRLLEHLKNHRCLLILDNVETILSSGNYREEFEVYSEFFRKLGELRHQSCLILTSREKPKEIARLEGKTLPVRSLQLSGITIADGQKLLASKGNFSGADKDWRQLIQSYAGNPLALKIVATTIRDLFNSDIAQFLAQGAIIFGDIEELLDGQFTRLSELEKEIMYWLAINREPIAIADLQADLLSPVLTAQLITALESLERRSLIEKRGASFSLQPVLMEYVTYQLIQQICQEIETQTIKLYKSHALIKAQTKDYIQDIQIRLILQPIINRLGQLRVEAIAQQLMQILDRIRNQSFVEMGYAGGNTINLLRHLEFDLDRLDFSSLTIWQADLRGVTLHQTNFSGSDLSKSAFTERFSHIYSMAVSLDGKLMATCDTHGEISLWRLSDGHLLSTWEAHEGVVRAIVFSPDGQSLISGGDDHEVKQWNLATGQCQQIFRGHKGGIWSLDSSPDGHFIASSSADGTIALWDIETGECLWKLEGVFFVGSLAFSPNSQILACAGLNRFLQLYDVKSGKLLKKLQGHSDIVFCVKFSFSDRTLISAGFDRSLRWWDVETGECLRVIDAHRDWIWAIACSNDGMLVSSSADKTIKLWDIQTGQLIKTLQGHKYGIRMVLLSGDRIISSDEGQTLKIWDIQTGRCLTTFRGHSSSVWTISFSPDGQTLATSQEDQSVKLIEVATGKILKTLRGHTVWVRMVSFSPDGETVASCGADGLVKLWNVETGQCLQTLRGHNSFVWSVIYSPDGQNLASCGADSSLRIWDRQTGQCLKNFDNQSPSAAIAYSPNGKILASCGFNQSILIWDTQTGQCLRVLQDSTEWGWTDVCWAIAFHPDGRTLASSSENGLILIWDVVTGQCLQVLEGHTSSTGTVVYSPDGRILASASRDRTIRIWDAMTGECIKVLKGHQKWVLSLAFTTIDRKTILASSSEDRTIRFWDLDTGESLKTLKSEKPYEGMNIVAVAGISGVQKLTLKALGAIEW